MTRINVVPVQELVREHLIAEYREIVRVFALARKYPNKLPNDIPPEYTLGKGHVKFFYNKLGFVLNRYHELINEMVDRKYTPNPISDQDLTIGINQKWFGDYVPTHQAIQINRERIHLRMPKQYLT